MTGLSQTTIDVVVGAYQLLARQSATPAKAPDQGGLINGQDPTKYDPKNAIRLLFIQFGIILTFTQVLAVLFKRIRQPKVIAEVIGGIILGPSVMGHIPGFTKHIFPAESRPYLGMVANMGLCLFLFIVGLELDVTFLRRNARLAVFIGMGGMIVPFGVGAGFSTVLYKNYIDASADKTHFLIFIAVCYSITAFPVLCRILTALQLLDTTVGISVLAAGVGNDIIGWVLLALAVALVNAVNGLTALYILLVTVAWALVVIFPGRIALRYIARKTGSTENGPTTLFLTIVLLFQFASAFFTDVIGVHPIFGSFLVGIAVPREGKLNLHILEKIEDVVMILFLPLYFTLSGLNTNLSELNHGKDWGFILAIATLDFAAKFSGCSTAARLSGFTLRESFAVGSLMSCKGLVELIVLNVGLTAGILNTRLFSMYVVEALLLTSLTSPLVSAIYPPKYHTKISNGQILRSGAKTHEEGETDDGKGASESRHSLAYEEDDEATWKTRFLAVLDKAETLPALLSLTQLFQPQQKTQPIESKRPASRRPAVDSLRLINLSDRTSAVMISQNTDTLVNTDPVVGVFRTFTGLSDLSGSAHVTVVPEDQFANSVTDYAEERNAQLILSAWTLAYNEAGGADIQANFLRNVFSTSSVDVALFVEPSFASAQTFGRAGKKHLFLPFFGGPDDRLALKLLVQLTATNPDVSATVVRISKTDGADEPQSPVDKLEGGPHATATSAAAFPDTVYGNVGTQMRLQSDTADNVLWSKLQGHGDGRPASVQDALNRIEFATEQSATPLGHVAELARITKAKVEGQDVPARFIGVVGRSRRLATENHATELNVLVHQQTSAAINADVRRTLGDVASALVLSDLGAGLVVLQATVGRE